MDAAAVRERADELPAEPGVYQFTVGNAPTRGSVADDGTVPESRTLYVGKAVDLRSRVRSYADPRSARVRRMVEAADDIAVAVTDTETQALLLEANLIKRHQPRFNVRLKDDKSYPMLQLTAHDAPRIEVTRDPDPDATVFGPYTDKGRVDAVVKAIREQFGLRGCSDHKYANRDRPCLDFEMGLCTAPCTGEIALEAYREDVATVERFLEGETGVLAGPIEAEMEAAAADREYERAAHLRDRLAAVEAFHEGAASAIQTAADDRRVDVLGVAVQGEAATVARLHAEGGKLVERDRHTMAAPTDAVERVPAVLAAFLVQFYADRPLPDAILLPEHHGDADVADWLEREGVAVSVPGAGREATLVELALKNARRTVGEHDECALLAEALGLDRARRIEGFDVSHARGRSAVGSNVTFADGTPDKAGYRRKKLAETNDDYANMRSLLEWRARRQVEGRDERPEPDLLVIDGGAGQREAALEGLAVVGWDVPVVALAKAEERVVGPDGTHDWPDDAPQLHLLQRVRDEAHRFAVQYHQTLRDDVSTVLEEVPGVGPKTRRALLRRFGSVQNVRAASREELLEVEGVGEQTAETLASRL